MTAQIPYTGKNGPLRRLAPLAVAVLAAGVVAACSSGGSGSGSTAGASSGTTSQAGETSVGNVTLHIGAGVTRGISVRTCDSSWAVESFIIDFVPVFI